MSEQTGKGAGEDKIVYRELSYKIKEAALAVHNYFGPGFMEKVYENALFFKLCGAGITCRQQEPLQVYYEDGGRKLVVGEYVADIVVDGDIIIEVKATEGLEKAHFVQVRSYLKATDRRLGLLINFGTSRLGFERVLNAARREGETD